MGGVHLDWNCFNIHTLILYLNLDHMSRPRDELVGDRVSCPLSQERKYTFPVFYYGSFMYLAYWRRWLGLAYRSYRGPGDDPILITRPKRGWMVPMMSGLLRSRAIHSLPHLWSREDMRINSYNQAQVFCNVVTFFKIKIYEGYAFCYKIKIVIKQGEWRL